MAARQKVIDLCQRVADSFFGFRDAFGGNVGFSLKGRLTSADGTCDVSGRVRDSFGGADAADRTSEDSFQKVKFMKRLRQWTL